MKIFAAHNPDSEIRRLSSSGGVFSMLAERLLGEGGVVYGAAFDENWEVVHRRVTSLNGLAALRGSKYVFSNASTAYSDAHADLKAGRKVLFSGTPCQVAAMRKRAGENPDLLLVEIVCHGAPQPDYWRRYLAELCASHGKTIADITSVNFRDKRTGWKNYSFTVRFTDGSEHSEIHGANIFMRGFLNNYTLRKPCFKCPFKYPDGSQADITLGDFWGIEKLKPTDDRTLEKGISFIIGRTPKGQQAIPVGISESGFDFDTISRLNPALVHRASAPKDFEKFNLKAEKSKSISDLICCHTKESLTLRCKIMIARIMKSFGLKS